jgi:hypothetical protein
LDFLATDTHAPTGAVKPRVAIMQSVERIMDDPLQRGAT